MNNSSQWDRTNNQQLQNPAILSFNISSEDVKGPLNLQETLLSAQTSEPEWLTDGLSYTDVELIEGSPVKFALKQIGDVDRFTINVQFLTSRTGAHAIDRIKFHLEKVLGLRDDLPFFYQAYSDEKEPLSSTFERLRGLRLTRSTNLYESLIFSILSQNNSAKLMNRTARLLMQHYGPEVEFSDGSRHFLFPTSQALAKVSPRELRSKTSIGYRAKPVVEVSRLVAHREIDLEGLAEQSYEKAFDILVDLPGVGPKVADCFLLYGVGRLEAAPVDVWIHRIVSKLYFRRRKISRLMVARFLRERFGRWAGYAQLYLFDYARSGVLDSSRVRF
jgi:N-glycosylase/DNA lyase